MEIKQSEEALKRAVEKAVKEAMEMYNPAIKMSVTEAVRKQVPLKIESQCQNFACTKCVCGHVFSVHHGDGYYSLPEKRKTNYCPDCGQRLLWEEE